MDNDERNTPHEAAQESPRKKRGGPLQRLEIHRKGAEADHGWSPVEFRRMSVMYEDDALVSSDKEGAFVLHSQESVAFPSPRSGRTRTTDARHIYEIVVPHETARAIVEAYCNKVAASPEIATDAQLNSLARPLIRLLSAIIEAEGA